jgi:glycerophosphoryl diester phosphodiesterase
MSLVLCFLASLLLAEPPASFDVQGHRGARGLRPENTLPAFEKAIELGVTTLELDLQVTADRRLVVRHDPRPERKLCRYDDGRPAPRALFRELRLDELDGIDCGGRRDPDYPEQILAPGARIPTLEQVFDLAREAPYPVALNVEIKRKKPADTVPMREFAALVVEALRAPGLEGRVMVQSFDPEVLRAVAELDPEIPLALLVRDRGKYRSLMEESGADVLSPRARGLKEEDVLFFRSRGIRVIPWTVNEEEDMRRLMEWGVDGIITDYPDRLLALQAGARVEGE